MNSQLEMQRLATQVLQHEQPKAVAEMTTIKSGSVSPMKAISAFYRRMDDALSRAPEAIACNGNCSYCCHYHVYVTPVEVFAIVEYMEKHFDAGKRTEVSEKLAMNIAQTKDMTVEEHIATNIKCSLLSDAGRCLIYEVRPTACRQHHAINRTSCEVTFYDTASTMTNIMSPVRKVVSEGFIVSAALAAAAIGTDATSYEMNSALLEAMTNKASIKRWRDGKTAFPSVKDRRAIS